MKEKIRRVIEILWTRHETGSFAHFSFSRTEKWECMYILCSTLVKDTDGFKICTVCVMIVEFGR